jgi:hypothetical protein
MGVAGGWCIRGSDDLNVAFAAYVYTQSSIYEYMDMVTMGDCRVAFHRMSLWVTAASALALCSTR